MQAMGLPLQKNKKGALLYFPVATALRAVGIAQCDGSQRRGYSNRVVVKRLLRTISALGVERSTLDVFCVYKQKRPAGISSGAL
jgi:hypothetical protein